MPSMNRTFLALLTAVSLSGAAACAASGTDGADAADPVNACGDLAALDLIDMRIDAAESVEATDGVPAHCRVSGVIETEIKFELLLPEPGAWTGRFLMGGGGGFVGSVQNQARGLYAYGGGPLERGYATVGTDTGHEGNGIQASWALNHPERQENFGHRAVHLTAEAAKSIIGHYYDRGPDYSYFVGCSRGGGQAMMESQRYPEDFDGIVAAAPAYHWTGIAAGFVQNQQAIYPTGDLDSPVLTPDTLELLGSSILAACDGDDGVVDGAMTDPRRCDFKPADLPRCPDEVAAAGCVTAAQVAAIERVYEGPTSNGERVYSGFNYGGENDRGGWDSWVVAADARRATGVPNAQFGFGTELFKYFVFSDPAWDYTQYDFATWAEDTAATADILNATSTDLSAFSDRNGKIIYWTGWSDLALAPEGTIDYYEQLEAGDPSARDYARLYMLPGVLHCAGGPGPDRVDWVEAIRAWVEDGHAPERLVASKLDADGQVTLTRPVCPYPQVAEYDGSGDVNNEQSFRCATAP
ncbi:MAG: tannase/feruloyl esterase family alpha/beta hydrolase [Acidobacteria bacterium]|nr:tannase/feruloyl esterase family alpha/beta hydrolase [Acidobacteriota bacterium]